MGQRKGLGVSAPVPLYVTALDAESATVTVGPREALDRTSLTASDVNWISGSAPTGLRRITAQIRHRHLAAAATVSSDDDRRATVTFDAPQAAITPGQAAVFYQGDAVLGGGWID